jgi:hypothetical protein
MLCRKVSSNVTAASEIECGVRAFKARLFRRGPPLCVHCNPCGTLEQPRDQTHQYTWVH